MKNGLVTKIENNFMLIITDQIKIEKIKNRQDVSVGQRIEYSRKDIYKGFRLFDFRLGATFLSLFLAILLTGHFVFGQGSNPDVYARVSVDINPSLELELDREGMVVDYKSYNNDADIILNKDIMDLYLTDALEMLIVRAQDVGYLVNNEMILVSSFVLDQEILDDETGLQDYNLENIIKDFMNQHKTKYQFVYVEAKEDNQVKGSGTLAVEALKNMSGNHEVYSTVEELVIRSIGSQETENDDPMVIREENDGSMTIDRFTDQSKSHDLKPIDGEQNELDQELKDQHKVKINSNGLEVTPPTGNNEGVVEVTPPTGNNEGVEEVTPPTGNNEGMVEVTQPVNSKKDKSVEADDN